MKYFVKDLLQKGCTNYYKMCYSMCNVRIERFLETETLETDTQEKRREKRKDMKKKNAPIKVVAISSIAVLALAGISAVSVFSLAKNPDAAAASGIQNAGLDTASAKAALREDAAQAPAVLNVAGTQEKAVADAAAYSDYVAYDVAQAYRLNEVYEAPDALVVVSSVVENVASPETAPPVIATIQNVESVQETALAAADQVEEQKEEPVAELAVVNSAPVFAAPIEEPEIIEPVQTEPVVQVAAVEEPVYVEPVAQVVEVEQPVYVEPVVAEAPVEVVPVYEQEVVDDFSYVNEIPAVDDTDYADYSNFVDVTDYSAEYEGLDTSGSPASTTASGLRQQLVDFASSRIGVTPYVWAGTDLDTGTDCSGFVSLVYSNFGLYASAGSDDYQDVEGGWGENISYSELQPGDVVVYRNGGHVGIYAGQDENGNDIIIHYSNEVDGVKTSDMNYSTPTAFVRVAGVDSASTSDVSSQDVTYSSYSDEEVDADDWYYASADGADDEDDYSDNSYSDNDYSDYDYSGYDYSGSDDGDYGFWN